MIKKAFLGISALALFWGCALQSDLVKAQTESYNLRQQLNQSQDQITDLQSRIRELEQSLSDKQSELENSTKNMTDALNKVKSQLAAVTTERDNLKNSNADLQSSLAAKSDELSKMIAKLNGDVQALQKQLQAAADDNKAAAYRIELLQGENNSLKLQLADQQKTLDDLKLTADRALSLETYNRDLKSQLDASEVRNANLMKAYSVLSNALEELTRSVNAKTSQLSQTVEKLTQDNESLAAENAILKKSADEEKASLERENARIQDAYLKAQEELTNEIARGEIEIQNIKSVLTFNIAERVFFDSGDAAIKAQGREVLKKLGPILNALPEKMIRVEGHTDNVPIGANLMGKYPSNWELSAARAINVIRFLQDRVGIDPLRLIPVAYSEYHPIAPNDTKEGKAKNRRIEILLVDKEYYQLIQKKEAGLVTN